MEQEHNIHFKLSSCTSAKLKSISGWLLTEEQDVFFQPWRRLSARLTQSAVAPPSPSGPAVTPSAVQLSEHLHHGANIAVCISAPVTPVIHGVRRKDVGDASKFIKTISKLRGHKFRFEKKKRCHRLKTVCWQRLFSTV